MIDYMVTGPRVLGESLPRAPQKGKLPTRDPLCCFSCVVILGSQTILAKGICQMLRYKGL